jgi:hypothetical protein
MAAVLSVVASLAGCGPDAPSETRSERSGDGTGLRLDCTPNPVVRARDVTCAIRGGSPALAVTRWVFTNDEGRSLPPVERTGTGPGDTIWAGPAAVSGVVQATVRLGTRDSMLSTRIRVTPRW